MAAIAATAVVLALAVVTQAGPAAAQFSCRAISLAPGTLPRAQVGMPFEHTLTAEGGTAPYSFRADGPLPHVVTLGSAGVLSGAAAMVGSFGFSVTVTDANRCTGSARYTLDVDPAPGYLNPSRLQLRTSSSNEKVMLQSSFQLGPGSDGIDPATQPVSIKLTKPGDPSFYSKTITGFDATPTGWTITPAEKTRTGIQDLKIERAPSGYAVELVDTQAAIGANDYSHVTVELLVGNDSGTTDARLAESRAGSGHWQFVSLQVPGEFATIAAAIEAAPEGATIMLAAGTFSESFRIEGKRLRLVGSRDGLTQLVAPSRDVPILTYANGGGGELTDLHFVGGSYAVGSDRNARGDALPSALALQNVSIDGSYRGVYGAFSGLSAIDVSVANAIWNGFSLTHIGNFAFLFDLEIGYSGNIGLYVNNNGPGDVTIGGHYHHNAYAGVNVTGNTGNVTFLLTVADHNGLFGVGLFGVHAGMGLSAMEDQIDAPPLYTDPAAACEGAGLLVVDQSSVVSVAGTHFEDNCLGLSMAGATVTVTQSTFSSTNLQQTEGIIDEPGLTFGADNVCGYNIGLANESVVPCGQFAYGAPSPPEMIGGLE